MPNAIIVAHEKETSAQECINQMVRIGLIRVASVKGTPVYGRHYLNQRAIRAAYYKQNPSKRGPDDYDVEIKPAEEPVESPVPEKQKDDTPTSEILNRNLPPGVTYKQHKENE